MHALSTSPQSHRLRDPRAFPMTRRVGRRFAVATPTPKANSFSPSPPPGVYCRSTCAARPARRENVSFYATPLEAEAAGYRPCKRCRPDLPSRAEREAELVAQACRRIEVAEEEPALAALAEKAGLSPHHFHRVFKRVTGVTPKAYAAAHRQSLVQANLAAGSGVTETIYASGFNSSGRFYEAVSGMLGMTPSAYRKGGEGEEVCHAIGRSSLGCVLVAATRRGVCAILMGDDPAALRADLKARFPKADARRADAGLCRARRRGGALRRRSRVGRTGSTCRSTSAARPSSGASGRHCAPFRRARRQAMARSRNASAVRMRCAPWRALAPPTRSRSPSRAIASSPPMAGSRDTAGVSSASAACSSGSAADVGKRSPRVRGAARRRGGRPPTDRGRPTPWPHASPGSIGTASAPSSTASASPPPACF